MKVSNDAALDQTETGSGLNTYSLVKIIHSSETQVCRTTPDMKKGSLVIVNSRYGKDLARVLGPLEGMDGGESSGIEGVIRSASKDDLKKYRENEQREKNAFDICREKIKNHKLEMKLISAHYVLEESKILFFFTAESRVDFRELVKDLVSVFRMRVELRQVGVRDESRILGGLAVCGRTYCCHGVTDKLRPVSINMAKEQNLSLNSMKISGPCGRLLCCLSYEHDLYREEKLKFPSEGTRLQGGNERFKVISVNIIAKTVSVVSSDGRYLDVSEKWLFKDARGSWQIKREFFSDLS